MRALAVSLLAVGLVAACHNATHTAPSPGGGSGGTVMTAGTGGSAPPAGSGGSAGGAAGTGGTGGGSGSGGTSTAGSGGAAGASTADAATDGPAATVVVVDGGGIPGHEWVIPCGADWTKAQCCKHYCDCMMTNCAARAPANCLATCTAPGNTWNLKCKVEQCFESLDPRYPMDHNSHCGHATEAAHCQGIIP